jgi:cytochrome P450
MLFRNPRALAFVLLAAGVGLLGYYGEQRYRLPQWSEAEIAQSVELNLAMDLQRRGPHLQPAGERLQQLRDSIRAEVEAEIRSERETLDKWIGLGLVLVVLGAGQLVYVLSNRPR